MNITIENIMLIGSLLLIISIVAGKTTYKFGIPTLLLFLGIGMLAGSEGIGKINFDQPEIAQFIGIVALNFILFSGGLDTNWKEVKPILKEGISLSTFGVLFTALGIGTFTWYITDLSIYESLLLGSIVSSTDAAAVFSILRSKNLALRTNLRPTLEMESGSNDPMAYVLTISFLSLVINDKLGVTDMLPPFFIQMALGAAGGALFGIATKWIMNHIKLVFEGLYSVLLIALMFTTFAATDFLGGNGFLAIYICAVYLGNSELIHKRTIMQMYDALAWLMQIVLFLTLGLLVTPSDIIPVLIPGLIISLFLIFIARPLSVLLSLLPFRMRMRRRLFISWVGLRGAVPIVFATYPLIAGIDNAALIFNIVFFVSVSSVLIQGTTLTQVAKWLKVGVPDSDKKLPDFEQYVYELPKAAMKEFELKPGCKAINKRIVDLGIPANAIIAMINRNNAYITPGGATILEENDKLVVLSDTEENLHEVEKLLKSS